MFSTHFHHDRSVKDACHVIRGFREQGYERVACRPAVKLTFVRRDLIRDLDGSDDRDA